MPGRRKRGCALRVRHYSIHSTGPGQGTCRTVQYFQWIFPVGNGARRVGSRVASATYRVRAIVAVRGGREKEMNRCLFQDEACQSALPPLPPRSRILPCLLLSF